MGADVFTFFNAVTNILHEASGKSGFDSLANKKFWVLVLVGGLKVKAI